MLENKNDFKTFYNTTDFFIKIERSFSLYQLNKILTFIGIDYTSLYKMDKISIAQRYLYKENTNVFAYYIISALFLDNYTGFLSWCNIHNNIIFKFNPTENNLDAFYKEILNLCFEKEEKLKFSELIHQIQLSIQKPILYIALGKLVLRAIFQCGYMGSFKRW